MNNKIVSTKNTNAIFLAIVLVIGTFALASPSFMTGVQAVPQYGMEREYGSYEQPEYGMDSYEKPSYGSDDYKSQYSSYGKDNSYKSKDSSVIVKKVKCNNINLNLNGINIGDGGNTITNDGTDGGAVESASLMGSGNGNNGYDERNNNYVERNNDFKFVCINNNNNTVVVVEEPEPEPETCEECFTTILTEEELDDLIQAIIENGGPGSLQGLCEFIAGDLSEEGRAFISDRLLVLGGDVGISEDKINEILDCLEEIFGGDFPREIIEEPLTAQQQMNWKS